MTPEPSDTAELLNRLRQQLILAQVRIMELEDQRDEQAPRLAELETLLAAAQQLADTKLDEAAHHQNVAAGAQAQAASLQAQLAQAASDLAAFHAQSAQAATTAAEIQARLQQTITDLTARAAGLDAELAALRSSRSWRWTAWLRSPERNAPRP